MSPLIDVHELVADPETGRMLEVSTGLPVRLLDVRWRLDAPEGRPAYLEGHLPGAVYVDLEHELALHGHPERGRHPLPDAETFTRAVRRWGIDEGDRIVVYDDNAGVAAARAWWLLRLAGLSSRVLDGGFLAWITAGGALESGDRVVPPGTTRVAPFGVGAGAGIAVIDEAARMPQRGVLVEVRAPEHYRGRRVGTDPVAGHIPGAINIPAVSHIDRHGRFREPGAIRALLAAHGIAEDTRVAVYCGSGVASAHSVLAFHLAGVDALMYVGSWSQWSRTSGRPAALGAAPYGLIRTA